MSPKAAKEAFKAARPPLEAAKTETYLYVEQRPETKTKGKARSAMIYVGKQEQGTNIFDKIVGSVKAISV